LFSQDLAAQFDVPFFTDTITATDRALRIGESLQEWARRLRFQAFETWAKRGWAIALGQHQDDLAENMLIRLSRGSSVGKLAGMQDWRPPIWRPLLPIKKSEILEY